MLLSKPEITKMFRKAAQVWNENKDYLSEIDSRFGDGDHGVTIGKIAGLMEKSLDGWDDDDVETFLEDLGDNTMEIGGGSAGPLYGTMIGGLSGPLEGNKPIDAGTLKEMFTECLSAMEDITNSRRGGQDHDGCPDSGCGSSPERKGRCDGCAGGGQGGGGQGRKGKRTVCVQVWQGEKL